MTPEAERLAGSGSRGAGCPHESDAVAWLQGELDDGAHRSFEQHLGECPSCRAVVLDARRILRALADTAPGRHQHWRLRVSQAAFAAAAAALLLFLGLRETPPSPPNAPGVAPVALHPGPVVAPEAGSLEWMESRLRADGSWDPSAWPALGAQPVGLHGLALLALTRGLEQDPQPARLARVERAARWLVGQQDESGLIGRPLADGGFDHPVATMALLEAWRLTGQRDLRAAADAAVQHLVAHQRPHEPWPAGNTGHAAWMVGALLRAEQLGWSGLGPAIARGRAPLGPKTSREFDGDCLTKGSFWSLALGPAQPRRERPVDDIYSASVALLAAR